MNVTKEVSKEILENKKVKLTMSIDSAAFEKGMDQAYRKNRNNYSIPGFRKGHVPRKVLERYYGEGIFYEDAINIIFPEAYEEAVNETGIIPVEQPTIDIVKIGNGEELVLTAEVAVKPDVELGQYKGLEIVKREYNVTDNDVDTEVENQRQRNARWVNIEDRPIKDGDTIVFDYSGSIDGVQFEGGTAEKQTLVIGSGHFIPGFEEQMVGISIGEEKDINVKFPEEYHAEDLKGKDAVFKVKVHEIKEKELPELDDEFVKDISEFDTLEDYKKDTKAKLEKNTQKQAEVEMENEAVRKVVDAANVDIPEAMVETEIDDMMTEVDYQLRYNGLDLKKYLEMMNTSEADFRAQYNDEAYNRVKTRLVLEKVIEVEGIEASEEDIEAEYQKLAEQYGRDIEEVKKNFASRVDYMKANVRVVKAVELIMAEAVKTEKKEEPEEQAKDAEEVAIEENHENQ